MQNCKKWVEKRTNTDEQRVGLHVTEKVPVAAIASGDLH